MSTRRCIDIPRALVTLGRFGLGGFGFFEAASVRIVLGRIRCAIG